MPNFTTILHALRKQRASLLDDAILALERLGAEVDHRVRVRCNAEVREDRPLPKTAAEV